MEKNSHSNFDMMYLRELFDDLSSSNKAQSKTLAKVSSDIGMINLSLKNISDKVEDQKKDIEKHDARIREVERGQDSCEAMSQIKGIWYHIKRLNAFKDMISSKAEEDTGVIDLHAHMMEKAADAARRSEAEGIRSGIIKYAPWFIVVFVVGVALATIVTMKFLSGEKLNGLPGMKSIDKIGSVGK